MLSRVTLSTAEKKEYINAVKCLTTKPKRTPDATAPGVKHRWDDFTGVHINQSFTIHYTVSERLVVLTLAMCVLLTRCFQGTFLPWHRYFVWEWEKALRDECGYTGYQP